MPRYIYMVTREISGAESAQKELFTKLKQLCDKLYVKFSSPNFEFPAKAYFAKEFHKNNIYLTALRKCKDHTTITWPIYVVELDNLPGMLIARKYLYSKKDLPIRALELPSHLDFWLYLESMAHNVNLQVRLRTESRTYLQIDKPHPLELAGIIS